MIELWIGKDSARVNGAEKPMDISPQIINERTMLPLRFISENLGCQVNWDEDTKKNNYQSSALDRGLKSSYDTNRYFGLLGQYLQLG